MMQVITSDFHMPRSRAIFEWVGALAEGAGTLNSSFEMSFVTVSDEGIDAETVSSRREREAQSLENLQASA